jgi:hypothetical protein
MKYDWIDLAIFSTMIFILGLLTGLPSVAAGYNAFISMIEKREGVWPGKTTVWPDCNCSVRYIGTSVHGHRYTIVIDKLD